VATLLAGVTVICPNLDADAVREIIDTDLTDAEINVAINFGYLLSRPVSGNLDECGGGDTECMIIQLLAAHFISINEGQAKSESVGGEWSITYRGEDGKGLESSLYGQAALTMDCSGKLAKAGLKKAQLIEIGAYDFPGTTFVPPDRSNG